MSNKDLYNTLKRGSLFNLESKVESYFPTITETDYSRGFITRYFIQKINDKTSPIFEVHSSEYSRLLSNNLFTGITLKWRILGPIAPQYDSIGNILDRGVRESNRIAISLVSDKIPNLKFYLPNLLQFHK
jgi:hypothetical protein